MRGLLHFRNVCFAVLDEVDRMLDIGFREDIRASSNTTPPTVPDGCRLGDVHVGDREAGARRYMRDPEKITTSGDSLTVSRVCEFYLAVNPWDKRRLLVHLLKHEDPAMTIVFCRLSRTVDELAKKLTEKGIAAHAMHGDLSQGKGNSTMEQLCRAISRWSSPATWPAAASTSRASPTSSTTTSPTTRTCTCTASGALPGRGA